MTLRTKPADVRKTLKHILLVACGFAAVALVFRLIPEAAKLWVAIGALVCMSLFWSRRTA